MIKFTWKQLLEKAIPYTDFRRNASMLEKIKNERDFLLFVNRGRDTYAITDTDAIHSVDECDGDLPIRLERSIAGDDWIGTRKYNNGVFVVVPASIFTESQTTQPTSTGTNVMSTQTTQARRTVRIELIDNDPGLDVQHSLVAAYDNIMTEDDDATTIQELIMTRDIARKLREHNATRESQIDLDVQKRTGNTVNLQPVKLKDLTWIVK